MNIVEKRIYKYAKENMNEVLHTTLNPEGPGVVRIHLVPPKITEEGLEASIAIINGQDIIPVGPSWAILLAELIRRVNKFNGKPVTEEDSKNIVEDTVKSVRKVYPFVNKKVIRSDIFRMMETFVQIARGEVPTESVEYTNIGEYADYMKAPHRMDLLVSSMSKDGKWNCNQRCVHCYAAGQVQAEEEELSTSDWKSIIDKLRMIGVPQVTFTGGEPTLREDIIELIEYSKWFVTRLNTNGIKLDKAFCQELMKASLDSCQITFYSCDEAIHNKLVGVNEYAKTVEGIDNALEAGINISINTPLCKLNSDYVSTLEFLNAKGVRYVTCSGIIASGNALLEESTSVQLEKDEIKKVLKDAVEYCYSHGMEISFTSPGWIEPEYFKELGINEPTCGACLSNMAITPSGKVVPCQSYLSSGDMGDILHENWECIWNSKMCTTRRHYSAQMSGKCPLREEEA